MNRKPAAHNFPDTVLVAPKANPSVPVPLPAQLMKDANVPFQEALWYAKLRNGRDKVRALLTRRGERIFNQVRNHLAQQQRDGAMA